MTLKKSKKASLENKRSIFFEVGIIIALAAVLLAFEWTTVRTEKFEWTAWNCPAIDEDMVDITIHEKKKLEMPKPVITPIIVPIHDEIEVDDTPEIDAGVTDDTRNDPDFVVPNIEEVEEEDDVIHVSV
jgi:protein TonB